MNATNDKSKGAPGATMESMPETKRKLLRAASKAMRLQGYAATTVDRICADAEVTKGSFFHYFGSKEGMVKTALEQYAADRAAMAHAARAEQIEDPLARFERYIDIVMEAAKRSVGPPVCLAGMLAQELAQTNSVLREVAAEHFVAVAGQVSQMLSEAKGAHPPKVDFDPDELAWMFFSLLQGSFLVAKTTQRKEQFISNLQHYRAYVRFLFGRRGD